jgi:chromate reductase
MQHKNTSDFADTTAKGEAMATKRIAVIVGSLRKQSFNRKMAKALISTMPDSLNCEIVEVGQLPLYNQDDDDEGRSPAEWVEFRELMSQFEGVLFVTPEYNRSVPAVLKNAIDVGSRPYGKSIWNGKPAAIVSASPGAIGGFGANHHLRQSLVFLNMPTMQQPEAYIGGVATLFNDAGNLINDSTRGFITGFMESFGRWVEANVPH